MDRDFPGLTYTRRDAEQSATLFSNSTSSNYKLYRASWLEKPKDFSSDTFFFDAIATLKGGQQVKEEGWGRFDFFDAPFGCNSQ
jgi:hypothetical protein